MSKQGALIDATARQPREIVKRMTPLLQPGKVTLRLPSSHFCFALMSFDSPLHATVQKMSGDAER
jgi:hypothetical protein